MYCGEQFSDVTKQYLCCFYEILDNMIEEMTNAKLTNSISHNFIVQMIPHHQAAIKMSQNILQYTTLLPLQNIAKNIISEQTKGIEAMKEILGVCGEQFDSKQDMCLYQNEFDQITRTMFSLSAANSNFADDYCLSGKRSTRDESASSLHLKRMTYSFPFSN